MNNERIRFYRVSTAETDGQELNCFSLTVNSNEITGLLSMNQEYSREFINMLSGIVKVRSGSIFWNETVLPSCAALKKLPIAIIRQDSSLIETASIAENLFIYKSHHRQHFAVPWKQIYRQASLQLHELGIPWPASTRVYTLNIFQHRVIELIRAFLNGSELIVFDTQSILETTSNEKALMRHLLRYIVNHGVALLLISSRITPLKYYADQVSVLDHGSTQCFCSDNSWVYRYIQAYQMPALSSSLERQNAQAFVLPSPTKLNHNGPSILHVYKGELTEICDSGSGLNLKLISGLHLMSNQSVGYGLPHGGIRLLDDSIDNYFITSFSPLENLALSLYPRVSHIGILSSKSLRFLQSEFTRWYGSNLPLQKGSIEEFTLREKIALLMFRFILEDVELIVCMDSYVQQDYKAATYAIPILQRLVKENNMAVCILTSSHSETGTFYDRRINLMHFNVSND